ncbi:hypothetical protein G6O69_34565 [Pseudenhygromyxa sp. WMMC2535]|uniref:hypothetical protein n=1 Tax=Pseudenhygromyxa sp. WMMC2535 TaxID=2712867 RepID=UPI001552201E|nr:hypothetical protein [Pseudenhygromyxa sp. WMMC2535]NVB42997.1 hypothetical protein [Pseudenhygromyxa sp. WMMC2535]
MHSLRTNSSLAALLSLPLVFCACSGDDGGEDDIGASEESSETNATTETSAGDSTDTGETDSTDTDESDSTDSCGDLDDVVQLERLVASSSDFPDPLTASGELELAVAASGIGSDDRIYLVLDHDMAGQTLTTQFMYLTVDLNNTGCALNAAADLAFMELESLEIHDLSEGGDVVVDQGELGGGGEGEGVNVWDITEIELLDDDCGNSPLFSLSYNPEGGPYSVTWSYTGMDAVLRHLAVYVGREAPLGC